ncbi:pyruvate kinase [Metamycoplasma subdolum]|uniref:Pyruvate kinase n=1 Tax=Metamycoplasma subdolum TaxID=92407 RepID=A0A3M0A676_9BACT|nr:pyruvate kinase [Metamycoplasma subdolum]RMA79029.1 pyruvate kinase [Metamycoplasma subdolum]WPB50552.1 pyruvate kinase [Metamycoplasma subdolum]
MKIFNQRRTKIVATIGPSSNNHDTLKSLIEAGVTTVRVNFSHGNEETHKSVYDLARKVSQELDFPISLMLDTKGPEIRVGKLENDACQIQKNSIISIKTDPKLHKKYIGNSKEITVSYRMDNDVKVGNRILLDDGKLVTVVKEVKDKEIIVEAKNTHLLKSNKRVNIPGVKFSMPFLSAKDKEDIIWGINYKIDYIAASFVNSAKDVKEIRNLLKKYGGEGIQICSKIESQAAIENIDEIIEASDSIMIARGDLGLEIPYYDVPYYQKKIIRKCRLLGKETIVATQMLDSMEKSPLPTRAEVTDVYYAVELGADATMLSGESAAGQYPVEAVKTMANIAQRAEKEYFSELFYSHQLEEVPKTSSSRSKIAYEVAKKLFRGDFKYAVVLSHTGALLKEVAKYRPNALVVGIVHYDNLVYSFGITNGVYVEQHSEAVRQIIKLDHDNARKALEKFDIQPGDKYIVVDSLNITEHTY